MFLLFFSQKRKLMLINVHLLSFFLNIKFLIFLNFIYKRFPHLHWDSECLTVMLDILEVMGISLSISLFLFQIKKFLGASWTLFVFYRELFYYFIALIVGFSFLPSFPSFFLSLPSLYIKCFFSSQFS